jgi:tetratricopeptide (TPR) repeat protein
MAEVSKSKPAAPLWSMLARAADLLTTNPARAENRALEVLKSAPAQPQALILLVSARRAQGDTEGACALLESLAAEQPNLAALHYELGLLRAELRDAPAAIASLSRVVELEPDHPTAWRALAEQLAAAGDVARASEAYGRQFKSSLVDVLMLEHVMNLGLDQIEIAAGMLREFLNIHPTDVNALYLMSQLYIRVNRYGDAERVLARALEAAPGFVAGRRDYGLALHYQSNWEDESQQIDILLDSDPENAGYRYLKATALYRTGRFRESVIFCEEILQDEPENCDYRMAYASALRMVGRQEECIAVFRSIIALEPGLGDAWWGLANLKTFRFLPHEIEAMHAQLARDDLADEKRYQLQFALGKALEDTGAYDESFEQYRRANALIHARQPYNPAEITEHMQRVKTQFSARFFRDVAGKGCLSPDPIFVVSLPRSGSTLVEQILASHSAVEGAGEIAALPIIAIRLAEKENARAVPARGLSPLPFDGEDLKALGEEYLERARSSRKLGRPFFTDKMPNNFQHLGLICAILPNARIIAVRRHPLACCFSMYRQLFPQARGPFYDLGDLGRYYRDFLEVTAHFDAVLPGRIHHIVYEDLVRDPETEIRRMLAYCALPFEEACLRFYESERPVSTASSEQVRRPVYTDALEQWRHYEKWLDPLKAALGPALDLYPGLNDVHQQTGLNA